MFRHYNVHSTDRLLSDQVLSNQVLSNQVLSPGEAWGIHVTLYHPTPPLPSLQTRPDLAGGGMGWFPGDPSPPLDWTRPNQGWGTLKGG